MNHVIAIDTETTGLKVLRHRILEIGAIRLTWDLQHELARFSCKVKLPKEDMDAAEQEALRVNGYDEAAWSEAMPQNLAAQWTASFCLGATPLAYNTDFDLKFLNALFHSQGVGLPWVGNPIDTLRWGKWLAKSQGLSNGKLETAAAFFGLKQPEPHRALDDALLALEIERRCRDRFWPEERKAQYLNNVY